MLFLLQNIFVRNQKESDTHKRGNKTKTKPRKFSVFQELKCKSEQFKVKI